LFQADDGAFHLADGVVVKVWRRGDWTPRALHAALTQIRRDGPQDASLNQGWAAEVLPLQAQIVTDALRQTFAGALFDGHHRDLRLFFDYPLEQGPQRLAFSYAGNCPNPRFHLTILTPEGHTDISQDIPSLLPGAVFAPFTVSAAQAGDFLQLDVFTSAAAACRIELQKLQMEKIP
jgi:hypothetical protein